MILAQNHRQPLSGSRGELPAIYGGFLRNCNEKLKAERWQELEASEGTSSFRNQHTLSSFAHEYSKK